MFLCLTGFMSCVVCKYPIPLADNCLWVHMVYLIPSPELVGITASTNYPQRFWSMGGSEEWMTSFYQYTSLRRLCYFCGRFHSPFLQVGLVYLSLSHVAFRDRSFLLEMSIDICTGVNMARDYESEPSHMNVKHKESWWG